MKKVIENINKVLACNYEHGVVDHHMLMRREMKPRKYLDGNELFSRAMDGTRFCSVDILKFRGEYDDDLVHAVYRSSVEAGAISYGAIMMIGTEDSEITGHIYPLPRAVSARHERPDDMGSEMMDYVSDHMVATILDDNEIAVPMPVSMMQRLEKDTGKTVVGVGVFSIIGTTGDVVAPDFLPPDRGLVKSIAATGEQFKDALVMTVGIIGDLAMKTGNMSAE